MISPGLYNGNGRTDILETFNDYFGEENTELDCADNSFDIIVHYPELTIENEFGETERIYDLFVKTSFFSDCKMMGIFQMKRTTFTKTQYNMGYVHSHISRLSLNVWGNPCLGSGPIRTTIESLIANYDPEILRLYCYELDKYVHTESIAGGPYIRMSQLKTDSLNSLRYTTLETDANIKIPLFLYESFALKAKEKFGFIRANGTLQLKTDIEHLAITVTGYYMKFLKEKASDAEDFKKRLKALVSSSVLQKCCMENNELYVCGTRTRNDRSYTDTIKCFFKGKEYKLKLIEEADDNILDSRYILNLSIISKLYTYINNTLNSYE